jgi:hypothetical protein
MLRLGGEHETRVVGVTDVLVVVVVVDPGAQPRTEPLDEGQRDLVEAARVPLPGESDIEHDDAPGHFRGRGELARGREDDLGCHAGTT